MRLRSHDSHIDQGVYKRRDVRCRMSKIQNNFITVALQGQSPQEVFLELQPLSRKTADAIARALIDAADVVVSSMQVAGNDHGCTQMRLAHVITGDGINTNSAALRRVLAHFLSVGREPSPGKCSIRYTSKVEVFLGLDGFCRRLGCLLTAPTNFRRFPVACCLP